MKAHELLQYLVSAGYTQKQIKEATGIHQPSISRILTGKQSDLSFENGKRLEEVVWNEKGAVRDPNSACENAR